MKLDDPAFGLPDWLIEEVRDVAAATGGDELAAFVVSRGSEPLRVLVATEGGLIRVAPRLDDSWQLRVEIAFTRWRDVAGPEVSVVVEGSERARTRTWTATWRAMTGDHRFARSEANETAWDEFFPMVFWAAGRPATDADTAPMANFDLAGGAAPASGVDRSAEAVWAGPSEAASPTVAAERAAPSTPARETASRPADPSWPGVPSPRKPADATKPADPVWPAEPATAARAARADRPNPSRPADPAPPAPSTRPTNGTQAAAGPATPGSVTRPARRPGGAGDDTSGLAESLWSGRRKPG